MWSMIWPIALVVGVNVFYHIRRYPKLSESS